MGVYLINLCFSFVALPTTAVASAPLSSSLAAAVTTTVEAEMHYH